jgi:general secretion pathway protein K
MILAVMIATEVAYETQVEYISSSQSLNRIKAYYAAKAGVELSLFRIHLYKKAMAQFGDQLKENKSMLDPIWQFPFMWPPTAALDGLNAVDKEMIENVVKESTMDSQYAVTIVSEGGKIDINDLGSNNKALAAGVRTQILQIFENELENNEIFKEKYDNYKFDELVNNIQDYIDEDKEGLNKSDETQAYDQPDDAKGFQLPPNRPFQTLEEMHMVADMQDDFFDLLKNKITVYGTKGINVNYADESVLKALDPQLKDEILKEVIKRRSTPELGGPFKDEDDFYGYLDAKGMRTDNLRKAKLPLIFDAEYNFRIISTGLSGNVKREITAITFDIDSLTPRFVEILDKIDEQEKPNDQNPPPNNNNTDPQKPDDKKKEVKIPKGRPSVVFWLES